MNRPTTAVPLMADVARPRSRAERLLALVILLAPAAAILLWHIDNASWPMDDAATYMRTAYDHYLALQGSLTDGLRSLYWQRGWRPIAYPLLAAPFLWIGNGNVLFAVGGVQITCLLAWLGYLYGIARLHLAPLQAAIAAAFVCAMPALAGMALVFYAEIAWLAACTAFVCHALRSGYFRHRGHALGAGLALSVAILMRPAETAVTLALPVIALLALAERRGTIGRRDLIVSLFQILLVGGLLVAAAFLPRLNHQAFWPLCGVLALAAIETVRRAGTEGSAGLALFTVALLVPVAFWYADFMPRLYAWVHATSFGAMARITDARMATLGFAGVLDGLRALYAGPPLLVVTAAAIAALLTGRARTAAGKSAAAFPWSTTVIALCALLPMLALYGWTGTSDPRRIMAGVSFAALIVAVIALADGPGRRWRVATVAAAVGVQVLAIAIVARSDHRAAASLSPLLGQTLPAPRAGTDPHPELVRQLVKAGIPRGGIVAAYTMGLHQGGKRIWEPFAAMVAAGTLGDPLTLTYRWEAGDYETALDLYRRLGVGYVLVEHFRDGDSRAIRQPYVQFVMALLDRIEAGEIHPHGLQLLARFELGGRLNSVFRIIP